MSIIKKNVSEKGIAVITVLGVCLVLLGLGTVLVMDSYAQMRRASKYNSDTEALILAEAGVQRAIYELEEHNMVWSNTTEDLGNGSYTVHLVDNNLTGANPKPAAGSNPVIPANSIWVSSTGTVAGKFRKTVEVALTYQVISSAALSNAKMQIGDPNCPAYFNFELNAIPGFEGKLHSNYNNSADPNNIAFDIIGDPNLLVTGATFSTPGNVPLDSRNKISSARGSVVNTPAKSMPTVEYEEVEPNATVELDAKVPSIVTFKGKLKNSSGSLVALCELPLFGEQWIPLNNMFGNFTPDGMTWNGSTGTIKITGDKKYSYTCDPNGPDNILSFTDINIEVDPNANTGLFTNGNIESHTMYLNAPFFTLASKGSINFENTKFQIKEPVNNRGVAIFSGKDFIIETNSTGSPPPGGNIFRGVIYVKNGKFVLDNKCSAISSDNSIKMEGLILVKNGDPNTHDGIILKNSGGNNDFKLAITYNPHLARVLSPNLTTDPQLQPIILENSSLIFLYPVSFYKEVNL